MIHLLVLTVAGFAGQGAPPDSIDRFLRAEADSGFSGVVWFASRDTTRWSGGYGDSGLERPFWIASVTKSFTAAAVLLLVRDRALSLDDPLSQLIPEVPADKRSINIRQLLTHTAGFGRTYSGGGITSRAAAVRAILSQPLARPPGSGYQYEDDSYELLAAVVEIRSGKNWSRFVAREILEPVGLRHTGFWCGRSRGPSGPIQPESARCGTEGSPGSIDDWGHRGANGMFSTATDLARWIRWLVDPPPAWVPVLAPMVRPTVFVRDEGGFRIWSGLGTRVYTRDDRVTEIWLSGSGDEGHSVVVRSMTDGTILVVLSSSGLHHGTTWSAFIADRLLRRS